jgi:hypothetical protein
MSGRAALAARGAVAAFTALVAFTAPVVAAGASAAPAQPVCAHVLPDRAISSPGWMRTEHTPQVVAYLAVIGTRTA